MALDPRYITTVNLEPYFVDKDTGAPLAGGIVTFYEDAGSRTTGKLVYQYSPETDPVEPYQPLPNPMVLSSTGTFVDAAGDNIAVYYYPYDDDGNIQHYYITVTNALGTEQFTREAWPSNVASQAPTGNISNYSNYLTNPQFAQVLFIPGTTLTITLSGAGSTSVEIAPGWTLNVTSTGAATVTVARNAILGSQAYPYNPPYTLTVTPSANITVLNVSQRLSNNPDIFSPATSSSSNGYISGSILLANLSTVTMRYVTSATSGAVPITQTILSENNITGSYVQYSNTVQLEQCANGDSSNTGYVDIVVDLSISSATTFSNLQIVSLETNESNVVYEQTPVNRQMDQMFNYYNPLLQYKPIPSFLVGWDFPYNPAQFLGTTVAAKTIGANNCQYVWDQTIVFSSANTGAATSRSSTGSGALRITATNTTQFALVQYLSQVDARRILGQRLSVNVAGLTDNVGGLVGTISLWYTTNASLPSASANACVVTALDANGYPTPIAGWTEVPRSQLGNAKFTLASSSTVEWNDYGFSGWDMQGIAGVNTATFFAVVVGFASLTATKYAEFGSISLVPGDIPTRPAPKPPNEHTSDCQYYYEKSFLPGVIPATQISEGASTFVEVNPIINSLGPCPIFAVPKISTPTITLFNPVSNNAQIRNTGTTSGDWSSTTAANIDVIGFETTGNPNVGSAAGESCQIQWTADSRLGV